MRSVGFMQKNTLKESVVLDRDSRLADLRDVNS